MIIGRKGILTAVGRSVKQWGPLQWFKLKMSENLRSSIFGSQQVKFEGAFAMLRVDEPRQAPQKAPQVGEEALGQAARSSVLPAMLLSRPLEPSLRISSAGAHSAVSTRQDSFKSGMAGTVLVQRPAATG